MTDERTGRELTPRDPEGDQIVVRERVQPQSPERFYAGDNAHVVGLTEERAAQIVRQSGNARSVAFLFTLIMVLFIPLYWFYDLGIPAIAGTSRLDAEKDAQHITDVSRGYELYINNCATCHGTEGKGGVGPPLNDQAKLYNAVKPDGGAGTGHLNPNYLQRVLEVGGRYVCGDPNSIMPAWLQPAGPLNYREVEEIIAFLTASTEDEFTVSAEEHGTEGQEGEEGQEEEETQAGPESHTGWRDPNYQPAPDASPIPACWRPYSNPAFSQAPAATAAPIENPGTAENPRVIQVNETGQVQITDPEDQRLTAIAVKAGETVRFEVTNTSGGTIPHNFYIGTAEQLQQNDRANTEGTPDFTEGTQTLDYTFAADATGLQFACIVPGHYDPMHGDFQIQP